MNNKKKIIKIKKNKDGVISDVMFEDESIVPINHAILMAKNGLIESTEVVKGKDGGEFLRTDPNILATLTDLPTFKD